MKIFRRRLSLLPALGLLLAAVGCSSADDTPSAAVPSPGSRSAAACRDLHGELPRQLDGLDRADPTPRSELTAAWGGSAIILRCGVPRPDRMSDESADGVEVNGVGWLLERQGGGGFRLTSTLREAYIEVTLDKKRAEAGGLGPLTDLAGPIKKTVPEGIAG
ncbi:DUF3515 domain-containing protein [Streptomyces apocyni]|uniref:DUF3515 domain-containing protein n=1 Tax=Streptomyces apocyni TaxID=2654677 RepID=UPI0012EACDE5|nr:DUF3515 domain-containing protein [Streptomyces apocyni]